MSDTERAPAAPPKAASAAAARSARRPVRGLWVALAWLLAAAGAALLTGALLLGLALAVAYPNLPEISGLTDYRPKLPLRVISADGVLRASISTTAWITWA